MCGRYTHLLSWREIVELYQLTNLDYRPNLALRYNVAPSQDVPIVRAGRTRDDLWNVIAHAIDCFTSAEYEKTRL